MPPTSKYMAVMLEFWQAALKLRKQKQINIIRIQ